MSKSIAAAGVAVLIVLAFAATGSAQTGTIAGVVTHASTAQPLAGVSVRWCTGNSSAPVCAAAMTNAQGIYSLVVPAGTHYGYTANAPQVINQIYGGIGCPRSLCDERAAMLYGTPTAIAAGQVLVREFRLAPAGRVRGVVRDAATSAPLASVKVELFGTFQGRLAFYGDATTGASGAYAIGDLPAGTYYAMTSQSAGYVNQFFGDVWCPGMCNVGDALSGEPIVVTAGSDVTGREFALRRGSSISGTVTGLVAPGNATPVAGATIYAYALLVDTWAGSGGGFTDAAGQYTVTALPDGLYYLQVQPPTADGLLGQFHGGTPCGQGCVIGLSNLGVPIAVVGGQPTMGRDIQLARGGSVAGTVIASATLLPVPDVEVTASAVVSGQTRSFGWVQTDAFGRYNIGALPPGTYSVSTRNRSALVNEAFPNVPCPARCDALLARNQTVPVVQYATTPGRDFALDPAGSITGVVTDGGTGTPLPSVNVNLYTRIAGEVTLVEQARSNTAGIHEVQNLPAGTFWAMAFEFDRRLQSQIFDGLSCPARDCGGPAVVVAAGTPIVVDPPTPHTGINFNMTPGRQPPPAPFQLSATTRGYRVQLSWVPSRVGTAATGYLVEAGFAEGTTAVTLPATEAFLDVNGVPPGRYFLRVRGTNAFGTGPASEEIVLIVHGDGSGSPTEPAALTVWISGRRLNMTWLDPGTGERPTGYVVEAGSAAGLSNIAAIAVSTRSFSFDSVPDGFYFLRVRGRLGGNLGPPSREVLVKVGSGPAPPSAPLNLANRVSGSVVTFSWTAPLDGSPTGYLIEAGSMRGLSNLAVFSSGSSATTLTVPNVPRGTYFVRLRGVNAVGVGPPSFDTMVVVP